MKDTSWILIDTETTGLKQPIFAVELAAQRMRGWQQDGEPFRRLINHGCQIPQAAARVHGYTREILERDGETPEAVYSDFREYAGEAPIVAYNLRYDWNQVLVPEWERLGLLPISSPGFCAYLLAQRLLDPVPAGNCKLQTLRQYYRLPERGAHTALGDVETVADLMQNILRPIAEKKGLNTWEEIQSFTQEEWYPTRLVFGKFKGRSYLEAREDSELRSWLEWLTRSSNEKSARMGRWYIDRLDSDETTFETPIIEFPDEDQTLPGLVVFQKMDVEYLSVQVEGLRSRLANLETDYGVEKAKIGSIKARLFEALRPFYEERDRLMLVIQYRNIFIDKLLSEGENEAETVGNDYERESERKGEDYNSAASALEGKVELDNEQKLHLKSVWKKLVRNFHPDRFESDPEKRETYEKLTQAINEAKNAGDIELLERIASDPDAFIHSHGWSLVSLNESKELNQLQSLFDYLQVRVLEIIEEIEDLRKSPDFELHQFVEQDASILEKVIAEQRTELELEIEELSGEADAKAAEIEELTGALPF